MKKEKNKLYYGLLIAGAVLILGLGIALGTVLQKNRMRREAYNEANGKVTPTAVTEKPQAVSPTEIADITVKPALPSASPTVVEPTGIPDTETPFALHGRLSVSETKLVDKNGNPFQLKGVSTHGLQWFPQYVSYETFQTVRDDWNANVIRLAMYTDENGYCVGGPDVQTELKKTIRNGIDYATELGLYVIVDWHILYDQTPMKYADMAGNFFREISLEYAANDNVIYEICNEPNGSATWDEVKEYAEMIIPVIRANAPNAIVIVGTPTWSQDVDVAAKNPVKVDNVLYALHFYAGTHAGNLRAKAAAAIKEGLPLFVSEFGITDASGNGRCNTEEADRWMAFLDYYGIGCICWNLANKNESSSLLRTEVTKTAHFSEEDLSEQGRWLVEMLRGKRTIPPEDAETVIKQAESGNAGGTPKAVVFTGENNGAGITLSSVNSWNAEGKSCYQLDVSVKNLSGLSLSGWKVKVTCADKVGCNDFWCCDVRTDGNSVVISPASWNGTLANQAETDGMGMILQSDGALKIESVEFIK